MKPWLWLALLAITSGWKLPDDETLTSRRLQASGGSMGTCNEEAPIYRELSCDDGCDISCDSFCDSQGNSCDSSCDSGCDRSCDDWECVTQEQVNKENATAGIIGGVFVGVFAFFFCGVTHRRGGFKQGSRLRRGVARMGSGRLAFTGAGPWAAPSLAGQQRTPTPMAVAYAPAAGPTAGVAMATYPNAAGAYPTAGVAMATYPNAAGAYPVTCAAGGCPTVAAVPYCQPTAVATAMPISGQPTAYPTAMPVAGQPSAVATAYPSQV